MTDEPIPGFFAWQQRALDAEERVARLSSATAALGQRLRDLEAARVVGPAALVAAATERDAAIARAEKAEADLRRMTLKHNALVSELSEARRAITALQHELNRAGS